MGETYVVDWAVDAADDLNEIHEFVLSEDGPTRADALARRLLARADSLERLPRRGRLMAEFEARDLGEIRELVVAPYRICYRIDDRAVTVLAVLDGRREASRILNERIG